MQIFDITVPANAPFVVHAAGRYIKYVAGSNGGGDPGLMLTPGMQGGTKVLLQPGQAYRIDDAASVPDSWTVANYAGGATIVGKVVIGNGKIDDSTVQGVVQVVDGGKTRTIANAAFSSANSAGATPAVWGTTELYNPVGSGVRAVISKIYIGSSTAQPMAIGLTPTDLGANGFPTPKLAGGANGKVKAYQGTQGTLPAGFKYAFSMQLQAAQTQVITPTEPLVLPPGYGLAVQNVAVNADLNTTIEFYEEPNV
jgi:hypothetical protein